MNLEPIAQEIREILDQRRKEIGLSYIEENHVYYMKDNKGMIRRNFPSVTKIVGKFHKPFDAETISLRMAKGDREVQRKILAEWKEAGNYSTNMGSRVHYEMEIEILKRYNIEKEVRLPIFSINEEQTTKSDLMISAGNKYLDLMNERNAMLLDTEMVLGHPIEGYVGQTDTGWIMENKNKDGFGFVITDWKSNQPKNFEVYPYTGRLFAPFEDYFDNALGHYYLQIPLYARLLKKMLEGTKYSDVPFLGGVIILLKDDGTYKEYKVPYQINNTILQMNLSKFI